MIEIVPAILTNNVEELEAKIRAVEGLVKRVQIDIVDGVFANNRTVDLSAVANIETDLLLDVQLMTKEPSDWVEKSLRAMADRIIGHIEMMSDQVEFVGKVTAVGHQVGLALDLPTPVSALDETVLNNLDVVLVMSVKAGFGGQEFDHLVLDKIRKLDEIRARDSTPFKIAVDGGINKEHIAEIRRAGADEAVVGSALGSINIAEHVDNLIKAAYEATKHEQN